MTKKIFLGILLFLLVGEISYIGFTWAWSPKDKKIADAAAAVLRTCRASEHPPSCYDREIPKLIKRFTMEETFAVTKRVQNEDHSYAYCHVLGHALSAAETKKDPSKWKEVITRCPSGVCSNGCVHGAFQERFRTDVLPDSEIRAITPDLLTVCEPRGTWNPTSMEQATCYHALGHLLMYITGADVSKSVSLCDELAAKKNGSTLDFHQVCYDGAFMQIFQPLEPEDRALVAGKQPSKPEVSAYCRRFDGERRVSCVSESWPLFQTELQNPAYLDTFCGQLPQNVAGRCYAGMFYILVVQFQFDLTRMKSYCDGLSMSRSGQCYANTASRLIETDWGNIHEAVAWCNGANTEKSRDDCYQELASFASYNFHQDSPEFTALCSAIPKFWQKTCFAGKSGGDSVQISP